MAKKLKTLEENNAQAFEFANHFSNSIPQPNGVACPKCGSELLDSTPMITLTSFPAQKNVHCNQCNYVGYRFV
jgi:hypothetical protein